jgi:hypothetical protein
MADLATLKRRERVNQKMKREIGLVEGMCERCEVKIYEAHEAD